MTQVPPYRGLRGSSTSSSRPAAPPVAARLVRTLAHRRRSWRARGWTARRLGSPRRGRADRRGRAGARRRIRARHRRRLGASEPVRRAAQPPIGRPWTRSRRRAWLVCEPCRRSLTRLVAPLCARCGAPTAWPVARCAECSGRRLAFASARAAVAYSGVGRRLVRAWKERGLRPFAAVAAELVAEVVPGAGGRRHHVYPARRRSQPEARSPAGGGARPRARGPLEPRGAAAARADATGRAPDRADAASSDAGTSAARSSPPRSLARRAPARWCSSTTSTRPARPPPRRRPLSARPASGTCTS